MFGKLRLIAAAFAALFVMTAAGAATAQINTTVTLDNTTVQTGRINRLSVPQTCAATVLNPGLFAATGARAYDSYTITNSSAAPLCYGITLAQPPGNHLFAAAYLNAFNPADPSQNWLGDAGSSGTSNSFVVPLAPGQTAVIVVHEVNPGDGVGMTYTLSAAPLLATVPTMSEWAMILMALLLAGGAAWEFERRRRLRQV